MQSPKLAWLQPMRDAIALTPHEISEICLHLEVISLGLCVALTDHWVNLCTTLGLKSGPR